MQGLSGDSWRSRSRAPGNSIYSGSTPDDEAIRDAQDLIEDMAEQAPQELALLIVSALNELRGAVDEGHADPALLRDVANHAAELARLIPFTTS